MRNIFMSTITKGLELEEHCIAISKNIARTTDEHGENTFEETVIGHSSR